MALKTPFYMIEQELASCGYNDSDGRFLGTTMVQHDPSGEVCFLHRNLLKWHITKKDEKVWRIVKRFRPGAIKKEYFFGRSNCHQYIDLMGDTEEVNVTGAFGGYEEACLKYLHETRVSRKYVDFAIHTYFSNHRYAGNEKLPAISW
jgi:alpha 1,2-mannosyltransferase